MSRSLINGTKGLGSKGINGKNRMIEDEKNRNFWIHEEAELL
jgi:hypothetical protein